MVQTRFDRSTNCHAEGTDLFRSYVPKKLTVQGLVSFPRTGCTLWTAEVPLS